MQETEKETNLMDKILAIIDNYKVDELDVNELIVLDEKLEQIRRHITLLQSDITKAYKAQKIQEIKS